ncbi:MAG TPA: insulinase family protein [Gemmatimonadales bacterium]|nr:insulinase family protein [Gemmatimonadales bacterium]
MTPRFRAAAAALLVLAGAAPLPAQGYPKTPPAPGPLTPAPFPPFRESVLPNGLRLLVVESHKQPVVSISLSFPAGASVDPAGKEGLASMVAGLLTKGAGRRTADQISDAIEGAGGSLSAGAGADFLAINSTVLTPSLPLAFELLGDAAVRPTFPASEVELLRTQSLSGLQVALTQPETIADRAFRRAIYGAHPYSRSELPASLKAITRGDLVRFHRTRLRPGGALLVVAGDITLAEARRLALRAFQGWTGVSAAIAPFPTLPARARTELLLVHRPGSVQSNIVVGNLTYPATDPRTYAATVANQVLGGGAASRLFMTLREEKSWTYGAYSGYVRRKGMGNFSATTEVRTEVTDSALRELMRQLDRIGSETVAAAELDAAKGSITGSYPLSIESADQVADAVANARLYGLPADYVQTYRVRIGAVTAEQVQAVAKATIRPRAAAIIVVGDGAKIYDRIKDIAPVTIVDPEGKTLTPDDLAPKAVRVDFDLAALAARRDSFVVRFNGAEAGWMRGVLEKTADGFRYVEDTRLGAFVVQTTTLDLDASGAMKSVKQVGKVQGQDAAIDVSYAGGRAKGTASAPDPQTGQIKRITLDTALVAGTLDDNAVQAMIPAFRWAPGAKWTFNVLSAGQGEIKPWTLAVTGTEQVTVGTGQVEAYKAELSGPSAPLIVWVSTAAPHLLLKIAIAGQPLEFTRVP